MLVFGASVRCGPWTGPRPNDAGNAIQPREMGMRDIRGLFQPLLYKLHS